MIEICICKSRKFIYSENTVTGIVIAWAQWHPQLKVHMLFVQKQGGGAVLTLKNVWVFFGIEPLCRCHRNFSSFISLYLII